MYETGNVYYGIIQIIDGQPIFGQKIISRSEIGARTRIIQQIYAGLLDFEVNVA